MEHELEQLLTLTETLHARAEAGDWEAVEQNGTRQRRRLEGWFAAHAATGLTQPQRQLLEQILDLNRRVGELAQRNRDRLGADLHDLRRGRSGAAAYAANS
ncbi:flagellar protein FliT [Thiohalobacter thiocyanaticus]|uniref:Flagellar protein FliT n=1 Tax=Thiohalobacter thiocyanaticus TaxID=585455 RepID=A0A426QGP5_9GAMM|nr:flagellar protein FliT [Thiohalobacter thiocyanaticus]RRQ20928.1 flagellar protein FliT [Thiohalobacter thiocyanaticus]